MVGRAVLRPLVVIHRWLGIGLAPLFAMWFASGIVMHFVPFPQLGESERITGLAPLRLGAAVHGPADVVMALGIANALRARLIQRADGPDAQPIASAATASSERAFVIRPD